MSSFDYQHIPGAPKVLVVLHQESSTPGRIGIQLQAMGYNLEACRPPLGQQLPEKLEDYAGCVVFGGPMSANDSDEFVKRETDWIGVPLKEEKPFLGICLGAQMMSIHMGGEVKANVREYAEIGYYPLEATSAGEQLMDWPSMVYQWHREGFSLPSDCTLLAGSPEYPIQAMRHGKSAYGIQFHSELTLWMLNRWTTKAWERLSLNGAQSRKEQLEGRLMHDAAVLKWMKEFLHLWIGPAER